MNYVSAINPSYYIPISNDNNRYYGYDHVGSYFSNEKGFELTGFFYPTKKEMANASVLFMEDKIARKNYWVIVVDNEIKFRIEAQPDEKPRSEERRVGKECRNKRWTYHKKR